MATGVHGCALTRSSSQFGPVLVGIYIRVSLAREEMISPELQQRDVDAWLRRMTVQTGREHVAVMVEKDLDKSGRSFARTGIQRLMTALQEGSIHKIATYRFDRFGRNLKQALQHLEEVEKRDGEVVSVTEPFDVTTAIGQFMRGQALAMADLQSKQIGEGWKRVQAYRVDKGLPGDGRDRYGYVKHKATHRRRDGAVVACPQGCA